MSIHSLLITLLHEDICSELRSMDLGLDLGLGLGLDLRDIVSRKIREKDISFEKETKTETKTETSDDRRCYARIWDDHRGTRCNSKIKSDGYCGKHLKCLQRHDYLPFGNYDEPRPIINEEGNMIPWYDRTEIESLDTLINHQLIRLQKLIHTTEMN